MKRRMAAWLSLLGTFLWLPANTSAAAPAQVTFSEVAQALGIKPAVAEYVVVVDTSGSMQANGLYGDVRTALASMISALRPEDTLSLVTFDSAARLSYRGAVGADPSAILATLPGTADGDLTDIGAGIAAGLDELERPDSPALGSVVLITDGKLETPPDSPYREVGAAGWQSLRQRARALQQSRQIAPYAVALRSSADAALLGQVFAGVENVPASDIRSYLSRVVADSSRQQVRSLVRADLSHVVEARWADGVDHLDPTRTSLATAVTLTSSFAHIPVEISALQVSGTGSLHAAASGLPEPIVLAPGESKQVPVTLAYSLPQGAAGRLQLTGRVSSPWQQVVTSDLGLEFPTNLAPLAVEVTATGTPVRPGPAELPWRQIGGGAVMVAALALIVLLALRMRGPGMVGSMAVRQNGELVQEFILRGYAITLGKDVLVPGVDLSGRISPTTRRNKLTKTDEPGVRLRVCSGSEKARGRLENGESLALGDLTLVYTNQRTRTLGLITSGTLGSPRPRHSVG